MTHSAEGGPVPGGAAGDGRYTIPSSPASDCGIRDRSNADQPADDWNEKGDAALAKQAA
jgi:hypothetical protein